MSDIENKLLPCPFCSGKPYLVKDHLGGVIRCGNCEARMVVTDNGRGEGLDIAGWNKRAIIEQDNVELLGVVSQNEPWQEYYVDWADRTPPPLGTRVYLHPPKDSTEPASKDAERYRYIRNTVSANYAYNGCTFSLPWTFTKVNLMKGSVAGHLDTHIDALVAAAPTTPKGE